jgi:hypothetical protein
MSQYTNVTPYKGANILNAILKARGDSRSVTQQSMYTLAKNGAIDSNYKEFVAAGGKGNGTVGKVRFDGDAFKEWMDKYLSGTDTSVGQNSLEDLVAEFSKPAEKADETEKVDADA